MVKNSAGHQQIVLSKNGNEVNLADVGFGYSQILPIITKFWHSQYKVPKRNEYLYNDTVSDTMLIEQPELHLHPQLQIFFMNQIRKEAQSNPKRIFFIISHSPFFIDLRFPEDLIGVIVCHTNKIPTHIEELSPEDDILFRRFLPRFNTYHKQFFFSDKQIFVEGYTDQQMFTYLLSFISNSRKKTDTI